MDALNAKRIKFCPLPFKNSVYAPIIIDHICISFSISYLKSTISLSENLAALSVKIRELQKMCKKGGSQCEFSLAPILTPLSVQRGIYPEILVGLSKKSHFWRLFPLL